MIPRRLYLENFMSYGKRKEASEESLTTIDFRDAQLWALCGENGSGKSAVFDAVTYALFDEHRLGEQHTGRLIHQDKDQLYVEFDFSLGEDEYRIKRSQNRKGYATRQILHIAGPNAPEPGRNSPQAIRETETDDGFKRWIERMIGLNYDAFTASTLLLQGKSDALLDAKPSERHRILTQIIDLDPYIQLFNRASGLYKESEIHKKAVEEQLKSLEPVDESALVTLSSLIEQEQRKREYYHTRQLELTEQKGKAEQWHELCRQQQQLQEKLQALQALLVQEEWLRQQSERYRELDRVLPSLHVILRQQQKRADVQSQLERLLVDQSEVIQRKRAEDEALQTIQQELVQMREQQPILMQRQDTFAQRRVELAEQVKEIHQIQSKRQARTNIDKQLAEYASNIDEQLLQVQQAISDLGLTKQRLKLLRQFSDARTIWLQQRSRAVQTTLHIANLDDQLILLSAQEEQLVGEQKKHAEKLEAARESVTRSATQLEGIQERQENLKKVDGTTQCHYCGQPLTAEHLDAERQRLAEEEQHLEMQWRAFQKTYQQTLLDNQQMNGLLQVLRESRGTLEKNRSTLEQQMVVLAAKQPYEEVRAREVLQLLAAEDAHQIGYNGNEKTNMGVILEQSSYPTEQDMQSLQSTLLQEQVLRGRVLILDEAVKQRHLLLQNRSFLENELCEMEQHYSPEFIEQIPDTFKQVSHEYDDVQEQLRNLMERLTGQEREERQQRKKLEATEKYDRELSGQINTARGSIDHASYSVQENLERLPSVWQLYVDTIATEQLAELAREQELLMPSEQQFQLLTAERAQKQSYEYHLQCVEESLAEIPLEVQRPMTEIEQEIKDVSELYSATEQDIASLSAEHSTLEQRKQRRADLETKRKEHARLSRLYKSLSTLLGPNGLQRYLLQRAEQAMVTYANETLDKISNGLLRIELARNVRSEKEGETVRGNIKGGEALDLVAYNYAVNSTYPLSVRQLSGGQKFRVAVSLALGIGKYAGGESRRVESVIIDEGFGSLDVQGRQDMVHVLHALKSELACVIVVSHHDEFFDEFENKYRMSLVDGSTLVSVV